MIAPQCKVDDTPALATTFPATIRSECQRLIPSFVSGAFTVVVRGLLAHGAGIPLACGTGGDIIHDARRADEH